MFDPIREVYELFQKHKKRDGVSCSGLMVPNNDSIFAYNMPAVSYSAGLAEVDGAARVWGAIGSIDDSGVSFIYPPIKSSQGGQSQFRRLADWMESEIVCPSREQIGEFCKANNCYAQYW